MLPNTSAHDQMSDNPHQRRDSMTFTNFIWHEWQSNTFSRGHGTGNIFIISIDPAMKARPTMQSGNLNTESVKVNAST